MAFSTNQLSGAVKHTYTKLLLASGKFPADIGANSAYIAPYGCV